MTLREAFALGKDLLKNKIEEYETDAWLLLEGACGCTRNDLYLRGNDPLSEEQETLYKEYLEKRSRRIPVQHILGVQCFCGLDFIVTPDVLCPRQDTEILIEEAIKRIRPGSSILDMCTGSGCIILTLLHFVKDCKGTAADLSEKALAVAVQNAKKLEKECTFIHSDLFENIEGRYDVIVSNPPYIATKEIEALEPEVRDMEPRMALDGMEDGLFFYRKIVSASVQYLNPEGWLMFEIGYDQGEQVSEMMKSAGYVDVKVVGDLAGLDRVVIGKLLQEV
ncbi:MAG: peptide chain release factor N(5)-glutamine methyltransferase [Lachnospiraceae bacterium]|nr:peptide chain release factor N(5)-glutamine methyltransferase [Lachnospiraceae bacterium]MEE1014402.1 peptide chain release factor N(5)-glutamine methyltransferase [Lachnospiraceae bacterium]